MTRPAPEWLADYQARFGAMLRTPLERETGTLTAHPEKYDTLLVADVLDAANARAPERLAVYNRQYWFRLFEVLHGAFPLTAALLGYWELNGVTARYLAESVPAGWDVDAVADGFADFFVRVADGPHRDVLVEAVRIDAAFRDVWRAPNAAPFRPSAADAPHLLDARLILSPALRLVPQHYPLLALRARLLAERPARVDVPAPLARGEWWAIQRRDEATLQLALEPREAQLFAALGELVVRDALARVESECKGKERVELPEKARGWLARAALRGFFVGMREG
jgi:hypothetical protein